MVNPCLAFLQKYPVFPATLIAVVSAVVLVLNIYGLKVGYSTIFPYLFYIIIILVAYIYPRWGLQFTFAMSLVFFTTDYFIYRVISWQIVFDFIMFFLIATVVVLLTTRIQESENRFRGVAERSSEIILLADTTREITYVSPSFGKIFKISPSAIIGTRPTDLIHPDDLDGIRTAAADIASGKKSVHFTTRIKRNDGVYVPIDFLGEPIIHDGAFAGFQLIGRDVTEQVLAEEERREITRRLKEIIEFLPDPTFVIGPDGNVTAWNHAMEEISGITAKGILGKGTGSTLEWIRDIPKSPQLIDFVLHRDIDGLKRAYGDARLEGNIARIMTTVTRTDGKQFSLWISATPLIDRDGGIAGAIESLRDVSRLKSVEQALRNSNTYLDAVINSVADPIYIKDSQFRLVLANDSFCRFMSKSREDLLGKTNYDIYHKEDAEMIQKSDEDVLKTGLEQETEETFTSPDGTTRISGTKKSLYVQADGEKFIVGIIRDITERKKTERALHEAMRKLNMLSSITRHDVLNQITGLHSYIELAKKSNNESERLLFLQKSESAADAIQEQLEFTRSYEALGVQAPRWQDVAELFLSAAAQLPLKGISTDIRVSGLYVYADPLIGKVFYNFIENTLRHGGDNVTSLVLSAEETSHGIIIRYEDDGLGIPTGEKARLFNKGFGKHTGLGLFLTREILSITGIMITENGEPGRGVRFDMLVPKGAYGFRNK